MKDANPSPIVVKPQLHVQLFTRDYNAISTNYFIILALRDTQISECSMSCAMISYDRLLVKRSRVTLCVCNGTGESGEKISVMLLTKADYFAE